MRRLQTKPGAALGRRQGRQRQGRWLPAQPQGVIRSAVIAGRPSPHLGLGGARGGHRRSGLHRLARRRRARRARRRGTRRRQLCDRPAREPEPGRGAARARHPRAARPLFDQIRPRWSSTSRRRRTSARRWSGRLRRRGDVLGTVNVLEAARPHGAQLVFSSTGGAIYGGASAPLVDDPRRPLSPYGTAKLAAEEYLATWNRLTARGTSRFASRTSTARGSWRSSRAASSRSSPTGCARASRVIFGDGEQTRRLRLRR